MTGMSIFLLLLASLAWPQIVYGARVRYIDQTQDVTKRTYSEHHRIQNPVKNCTDPQWTMGTLLNTTATISVADCYKVLENTRYNKGYYEVWSFDNDNYAPITGFQSCVFAVARLDTVVPDGYAVIGNDDVVSAVAEVVGSHIQGEVLGSAGVWTCGPNNVHLQLIVYNGLEGWQGSSNRIAPVMNMSGDWNPTATASVVAPTVSNVPTETPVRKNVTWGQRQLVYRYAK